MKVILKENIDTLGTIGDIVKVAPGYARNYLLPKGFAIEATSKNAKALEHAKRQMEYKKNKVLEQAKHFAERIAATPLNLQHQAGEGIVPVGRNFDDISAVGFAKQAGIRTYAVRFTWQAPKVCIDAQIPGHSHFRQRHRQSSFRAVVATDDQSLNDRLMDPFGRFGRTGDFHPGDTGSQMSV